MELLNTREGSIPQRLMYSLKNQAVLEKTMDKPRREEAGLAGESLARSLNPRYNFSILTRPRRREIGEIL